MKTKIYALITLLLAPISLISIRAQTVPSSTPTTVNQPRANYNSQLNTSTGSSMTFSNSSGQTFTVDQLANQLKMLRTAVDQTLPMLTAFNQSSAATGSSQDIKGRLEGLVSGALSHNTSSPTVSNLLSSLKGVLGSNTNTASATDAKTLQDLATLQNDLQPLPPLLQSLNIGGSSTTPNSSQIISSPANAGYNASQTNAPGTTPTPTGRQ